MNSSTISSETLLKFSGELAPQWGLTLAIIFAVIVFLLYQRETRALGGWARWILPTIRAATIALVILILVGPVLEHRRRTGTLGHVTFLVDASPSMQTADVEQGEHRLDLARKLIGKTPSEDNEPTGLIKDLLDTHTFEVLESSGETDLGDLLTRANGGSNFENSTSPPTHTVVLISDGRNVRGDSPTAVASELHSQGISVATLGLGRNVEPDDIAVIDMRHPQQIDNDSRLRGSIRYKRVLTTGEPVVARIVGQDGQELWRSEIGSTNTNIGELEFDIDLAQYDFRQPIDEDVVRRVTRQSEALSFKVELIPPASSDLATAERPFGVSVVEREYQLLILDGRGRWETRYLRNLFSRDPNWQVTTVLAGPGTDNPTAVPQGDGESAFPLSFEKLIEYDLVVIGDINPELLPAEADRWLVQYVDLGGGVVLIDGDRNHLRQLSQTAMAGLIPVEWVDSSTGTPASALTLTTAGATTPWLKLTDGSSTDAASMEWTKLKAPHGAQLTRAKPDAEVLISARIGDGEYPFAVRRGFGGGQILYLSSGETWRWRYRVADEVHSQFWNQAALALMPLPMAVANDVAALDSGAARYDAGERAIIRTRLTGPDGKPDAESSAQAELLRDDEVIQVVPLNSTRRPPGTYLGQSEPLAPGDYVVRLIASGHGEDLSGLETRFTVVEPASEETLFLAQDAELLRQISQAGGGEYFSADTVGKLLNYIKIRADGRIERTRTSLWDSYYMFIPLALLLSIEWWVRKRVGLP